MCPQHRGSLQAVSLLDALVHEYPQQIAAECRLQFICAYPDNFQMNFLEMSVKMHKFGIICVFFRKRMQSCADIYAVCAVP